MATISTTQKYVWTNSYTTTKKFLAASNNSIGATIAMIDTLDPPPALAQWFITKTYVPGNVPYYRIHTVAGGGGISMDVLNDKGEDSIGLIMTGTGDYSGQNWRFDNWTGSPSGGYRLTNQFTGLNSHLDVWADTYQAHLAKEEDRTGQHWTLSALGSAPTGGETATAHAPTTVSMIAVTATHTVTSVVTGTGYPEANPAAAVTPISNDNDDDHNHSHLSHGALAGIAAGAVALIAVIVGLLLYIFCKKRMMKKARADSTYGGEGGAGTAYTAAAQSGGERKHVYGDPQEAAPMMSPPPGYYTPSGPVSAQSPGPQQWAASAGHGAPAAQHVNELPAQTTVHAPSELPG